MKPSKTFKNPKMWKSDCSDNIINATQQQERIQPLIAFFSSLIICLIMAKLDVELLEGKDRKLGPGVKEED